MSELSSRPAREPVVYTLEQVATIPEKQWHAFVLAVTETFWQLPEALRPQNAYFGSLTRASELFPVTDTLAFYSWSADGLWSVNVTIEREHHQNILVLKELNFGRQPGDFFARTVFVLLHNLCPDCFRIHSTAGGASWSLPLKWIKRYLGHENFSAPESVLTSPVRGDAFDRLLLQFLSGQGRQLSPDDWSALEEAEHQLYWLRALAGGH
ncbi:hypothetical protein [Escherichia coli]|uniref:hypothetical protein n=1 Tax=Escherichia coli TaxID=562 RepID=UPI003C7234DC